MKPACSTKADFSVWKCSQSRTAIPKSMSRVRRPAGLPKTCQRITSRAVEPARKYLVSCPRATASILRTASRISGSIWSCLISKGRLKESLINHLRRFEVPSIRGPGEIGVSEKRRYDIIHCRYLIWVPEHIENLDISGRVRPHSLFRDEELRGVLRVNGRRLGFKIMQEAIGCHFAAPQCMVRPQVQPLCPARLRRPKSPPMKFRSQDRGINRHP